MLRQVITQRHNAGRSLPGGAVPAGSPVSLFAILVGQQSWDGFYVEVKRALQGGVCDAIVQVIQKRGAILFGTVIVF